ncbi:DUF421 domain-containing protein [Neobacillus notoginsengisoli]|uniref:DUF421 domain-containing protein n=1 Tax=Neobacillus notoginsengisoli TaxID=1578198 RepID=A0A417YPJ3_9BACI|nr:DUF421 domain-containing protein [Neobacillus notoginsengisoli]RHW35715.1 DUF421 domain-containing protein [Neobacillus notoginsengisoli]
MDNLLIPIVRTAGSFILLLVVTFAIGKHINAHKNHYSFALSVTIGAFIAHMSFHTSLKFRDIFIAFITLLILFYTLLIFSSRSRVLRGWLSGSPTVLIENGKILDKNMKKVKVSIDDLNQLLREKGVFNITEVEYALLEVSGTLSLIKKKPFQNATKQDLGISNSSQHLPIELIMDGEIINKNASGPYNPEWIEAECKKRNLRVEDIYYAVINTNGQLFIDQYEDQLTSPTDVE